MSVDRTPKRKTVAKRDSVSPQTPANKARAKRTPAKQTPTKKTPAKKKRSKPQTADQLEALLHLLDGDEASDAAPQAASKPRQTTSGRASKPARERTPPAAEGSSFMQELARARADLHKERRARIALEEELKSLRNEMARLAEDGSAKLDELRREFEGLRTQLAAVEKHRLKLKNSLLDAESQLGAEQKQRELLSDQVDALTARLTDAESKAGEQDELIRQARTAVDDSVRHASGWEARFRDQSAIREEIEQRLSKQVGEHLAVLADLETRAEASQHEITTLREQLASANSDLEAAHAARTELERSVETAQRDCRKAAANNQEMAKAAERTQQDLTSQLNLLETQLADANQKLAASVADGQQLRIELADTRREQQATAVSLDEMTAANERIEELEAEVAQLRTDLAESYEQLGAARIRLANTDRDRDHAQQRETNAVRGAEELSEQVKSLQAAVQREAAARRKAEAVHKRAAADDPASALFEAELKIERLARELAASKSVEAAYQQKAARKVQQAQQELESLRQRLAEIEPRPDES